MTKARDLADRTAADITAVTAGTGISISSGAGPIPTVTNTVATGFDAKGDLIVGTGADTFTTLTVGSTANFVLTVDSATTSGLKWAAASAGGITLIQDTVANANSSISFSSIAGTYKQLLLVYSGVRHSATGSEFSVRLNNNSSAIYHIGGPQFRNASANIAASSPTSIQGQAASVNLFSFGAHSSNAAISTDVRGFILIDNYASTTLNKVYWANFSYYDALNDGYSAVNAHGVFASTSAITSLDIVRLSGTATLTNTANTSIRLYGVS